MIDILIRLARSLYPRARAFRMPFGGIFYRLHRALAQSDARAFAAMLSLHDSMLPDNANFTTDDATNWERALGIYSAPGTSLDDRKKAIIVKMNFPGTTEARQHYTFIEAELRAAGFDVHIYENRFFEGSPPAWITKTPGVVLGSIPAGNAIDNNFCDGDLNDNEQWIDSNITICANYLEEAKDAGFITGATYRSTFFIAGTTISTFASVPAVRKTEFRQLVLQLKPATTIAFLFVNYV